MLRAFAMTCDISISDADFEKILHGLKEHGWTGIKDAAEESARSLAQDSGIQVSQRGLSFTDFLQRGLGRAEVFFRDGDIYYFQCVAKDLPPLSMRDPDDLYYMLNTARRFIDTGESGRRRSERVTEVGIVSNGHEDLESKINALAKDVEAAASGVLSGGKAKGIEFSWSARPTPRSRIEDLRNRFAKEDVRLNLANAVLVENEVAAAEILENESNRSLLLEIKTAGFAREADILSKRGAKEGDTKNSLGALKGSGLIKTEYLLQCKKSNSLLVRVDTLQQLKDPSVSGLSCATCSRRFKDEYVSEGHSVSALGKAMIEGSRWMTVWVTKRIVDDGVPISSIVWNLEESGEEVDIMIDFMGELWLIELKDREFGAGDAHPFNYRTVRYSSNRDFIVSTARVSADAKRVFTELGGHGSFSRTSRPPSSQPVYIEGLDGVSPTFHREIMRVTAKVASARLQLPQLLTGFSLVDVIS